MAEDTGISWTDATFNPWWGCQKVSPACDHCYAERDAARFAPGRVLWGVGSERRTFEDKHWAAPLKWAKTLPAKLGRRPRVFCASMADWLDLDAPIGEFVRLLDTIRLTPELDWLLLSKRIGNWRKRLEAAAEATVGTGRLNLWISQWLFSQVGPKHCWLGATVVNQEEADRDIPKLLATPARVRFLSIEPMLGPITLPECTGDHQCKLNGVHGHSDRPLGGLDWIIAGGESGPHARPAHPDWFRELRDQCAAAGVPFHFKQWGEWVPADDDIEGGIVPVSEIVGDIPYTEGKRVRTQWLSPNRGVVGHSFAKVGKKAAGRLLDGREHHEFPEVA